MYRKLWFLAFPSIWYQTYTLKQRRKRQHWSDFQYYQAMFSMVSLKPQVEGDKFAALREPMTRAVSKDLANGRILDLATGCGYQARDLWEHGYRQVYASDLVDCRVGIAQEHHRCTGIKFLVSDMQRLSVPSKTFDAITISVALHDLPAATVKSVLPECSRVLRRGGRLVILEPRYIRDWPPALRKFYAFVVDNLDESINMRDFIGLDLADEAANCGFRLECQRAFWFGGLCLYTFIQCI